MNDLQQQVDVWYALCILQVAYTSFSFQRMRNNFWRNFFFFFFSGMAERFSAQESADLIVNDEVDIGEMDSGDSFDEDWSSDEEATFQSEIESDDHSVSYSGCQVLINSLWGTNVRGQGVITRGGLLRGIGTTRGLSTGGRTIHGCLERS